MGGRTRAETGETGMSLSGDEAFAFTSMIPLSLSIPIRLSFYCTTLNRQLTLHSSLSTLKPKPRAFLITHTFQIGRYCTLRHEQEGLRGARCGARGVRLPARWRRAIEAVPAAYRVREERAFLCPSSELSLVPRQLEVIWNATD